MRTANQNLAVHFNANKRLVMEKIQVELTTTDTVKNNEPEPCRFIFLNIYIYQ